jgi:hypothetical protein
MLHEEEMKEDVDSVEGSLCGGQVDVAWLLSSIV